WPNSGFPWRRSDADGILLLHLSLWGRGRRAAPGEGAFLSFNRPPHPNPLPRGRGSHIEPVEPPMTDWIDIGAINAIPQRGARCVNTPNGKIAIFRTADDQVFAMDNRCPHKGGPLSEGIVHGAS